MCYYDIYKYILLRVLCIVMDDLKIQSLKNSFHVIVNLINGNSFALIVI